MDDNVSEATLREFFAKFAEQRDEYRTVARGFGASFVIMGLMGVIINGTLVGALCLKKRRHAPVFYTLILNFAVVDCFKGLATIMFALKLLSGDMNSESWWSVRVDQYSGFLLRFCNLATILNLALVTLHEYVYICYPLRYASLVTRTRVMLLILIAWIFSATVTLANSVVGSMNSSILIDKDCKTESSLAFCIRHRERSLSADVTYPVGLLLFCFSCLAVTTGTYVILFRVISRLIEEDVLRQTADAPQLLKRRKFVMVIGSVIVVYLTFLVAYSVIQIIQIMHINRSNRSRGLLYVKYICYVFVALHSLLQPLCYLRMKEFRLLMKNCICCRRKNGLLNAIEQPILSSAR